MCRTNFKFADFSDWVNVFKPGSGKIEVWENSGGSRGPLLFTLDHIPLTPGPLMVVIKVAASQTTNSSGYCELPRYRWHLGCILLKMPAISLPTGPPSLPDSVETIAASCAPLTLI